MPADLPTLRVESLAKHYAAGGHTVHAVAGVSLDVAAGEFVSVQGPSGCGKSTLLLAAGGLLRPDAGTVRVAGADLYALSTDARAAHRARLVGFVFQRFHLVPYLSVLDNVLAPSLGTFVPDAPARARALVERFGLADRARHRPSELSTGERQRTALARALLPGPKLLLADEPTGNLDAENARVVLGALRAFAQGGGAVLLVTHDPEAAAYATRTVRMRHGRVVDEAAAEP